MFVQVVKKSALDVIGLVAVVVTVVFVIAPRIYRFVQTVRNSNTVLVKTPAIGSPDIYMYVIQDSVNYWLIYFVSRETDIWVEMEKIRWRRKIYISKKQPELNELRQTVLLK